MKDNLFEMLLHLFEKSMAQLQKMQKNQSTSTKELDQPLHEEDFLHNEHQTLFIKSAQQKSIRVLIYEEQIKLTKASYQFLMRMKLWNIIDSNLFELILNQLQSSESAFVTLEETKWAIQYALTDHLDEKQLAFLDLVLYQKENKLTVH